MNFAEQFHSASSRIIRSFQQLGADWMLIGALPVAAWGQPRATTDADFAVSLELQDAERLDQAFLAEGLRKLEGPVEIPQKRLILSKYWDDATSFGVDVFLSSGYVTGRCQKEALSRKKSLAFDGRIYPVAGPEDLILYKVLAYRQKDLDDVGTILERQWAVLDWAYLKTWSDALGLDYLFKEVLRQYLQEKGLPPQLPLP